MSDKTTRDRAYDHMNSIRGSIGQCHVIEAFICGAEFQKTRLLDFNEIRFAGYSADELMKFITFYRAHTGKDGRAGKGK